MNFIDEALLEARAGSGGAGYTSFRRENLYLVEGQMVAMVARVEMSFLELTPT